ncbi:response regulator [Asticcacaulis machinosus]|uniref:Response regulator n=1 Tax=Asticcacaulis machinosus TaxID=2984211 RepID=A0ABT5HKE6_9CAUL|nr:response regulator [Asticcacaulis machinosus]MDC7676697.1 response regulator [Asticcacaulis machinosus]
MIKLFNEPFKLVMIEDDEGHARLIIKNLERAGVANQIVHVPNGAAALDYFFNDKRTLDQHDKTVILLDLNLPEIDGFEILRRLKADEHTKNIPVIVLTTTDNPKDIDECYALGCNAYMTKPVGYEAFADAIRKLGLMLNVVKVPHNQG